MISSVRINNDEYEKDQIADFALWKAYDATADGENFWEIELKISEENLKKLQKSENFEKFLKNNTHFSQNGSNFCEN